MTEAEQVAEAVAALQPYEDSVLLAALQAVLEERPAVVQELADWAVPDRAYAACRLLLDNRLIGSIKSFNEASGYGFIDCAEVKEAFGNDVFLHGSQLNGYTVGQQVSFAILVNKERKPQAFDLGPPQGNKGKAAGAGQKGAPAAAGKAAKGGGKAGPAAAAGPAMWAAPDAGWGAWKGDPSWTAGWGKDPWGCGFAAGACGKANPKGGVNLAKGAGGAGKGGKIGKTSSSKGPPETSMEMEGVTDRRFEGTIKSFNEAKGFGFISCDEIMSTFGGDAFLHHMQAQGFEIGQAVSFEVFLSKDGKPQAKELQATGGPAKRAKLI